MHKAGARSGALRRLFGACFALGLAGGLAGVLATQPASAQTDTAPRATQSQLQASVAVVDLDEVFARSMFGLRIISETRAAEAALQAEFGDIIAGLNAEENSLTERRPTMSPEDFSVEAEAFDQKVQGIRTEQDARVEALRTSIDDARKVFLTAVEPVMQQLMIDRGALVVLDKRSVRFFVQAVDLTDAAIAAVDLAIGDGQGTPPAN